MSLDSLDQSHIDLSLERMIQLMERLDNPHLAFKAIHIAVVKAADRTPS